MFKRLFISAMLILACGAAIAQRHDSTGGKTDITPYRGGTSMVKYFQLPPDFYPMTFDSCRMLWVISGKVYFHDCTGRVQMLSVKDSNLIKSWAAGGTDAQTIGLTGDSLSIIRGNTIYLPYLRKTDTATMLAGYVRLQRFLDSLSAVRSSIPAAGLTSVYNYYGAAIHHGDSIEVDSSMFATIYKDGLKELQTNKATSFGVINNTLYPSVQAVNTQINTVAGLKVNFSDTSVMLLPYLRKADSNTVYGTKYGIDTASKNVRTWAYGTFLTSFTESDPVANAKTITSSTGWGITGTNSSQTIGSNPAMSYSADSGKVATHGDVDSSSNHTRQWVASNFVSSETDPQSFHKVDSNTHGNAITYDFANNSYVAKTALIPAHQVYVGPAIGAPAAPGFRALVGNDIPFAYGLASVGGNVVNDTATIFPALRATLPVAAPGSPTNSIQYNNSGAFGGSSNFIWDGAAMTVYNNSLTTGYGWAAIYTNTTAATSGAGRLKNAPRIKSLGNRWFSSATHLSGYDWGTEFATNGGAGSFNKLTIRATDDDINYYPAATFTGTTSVAFSGAITGTSLDVGSGSINSGSINTGAITATSLSGVTFTNFVIAHLIGTGTPSIVVGPDIGTGGTATLDAHASDLAMTVTLVTGSSGVGGCCTFATVTFSAPFATPPHIIWSASDVNANLMPDATNNAGAVVYPNNITTTGFDLHVEQFGLINPMPTNAQLTYTFTIIQ